MYRQHTARVHVCGWCAYVHWSLKNKQLLFRDDMKWTGYHAFPSLSRFIGRKMTLISTFFTAQTTIISLPVSAAKSPYERFARSLGARIFCLHAFMFLRSEGVLSNVTVSIRYLWGKPSIVYQAPTSEVTKRLLIPTLKEGGVHASHNRCIYSSM